MRNTLAAIPVGVPVGYRRDGRPIYPIRGAEDPPATLEDALERLDRVRSDLVNERRRRTGAEQREQEARSQLDSVTAERDQARQQLNSGDVDQRIQQARQEGEQAGREAANAEWQPRLVNATAELVRTQARQAALNAGIRPEKDAPKDAEGKPLPDRVARFLALVDLNNVTGEDGSVKADELAQRVKAAATTNPEFVTASTVGGGGTVRTFTAAPGSGQGSQEGGQQIQFHDQVNAALADMSRSLRRPAPAPAPQAT